MLLSLGLNGKHWRALELLHKSGGSATYGYLAKALKRVKGKLVMRRLESLGMTRRAGNAHELTETAREYFGKGKKRALTALHDAFIREMAGRGGTATPDELFNVTGIDRRYFGNEVYAMVDNLAGALLELGFAEKTNAGYRLSPHALAVAKETREKQVIHRPAKTPGPRKRGIRG